MNELNHGPGKGDADRSPGWRKHYDEIIWPRHFPNGFVRRGNKQTKKYGNKKEEITPENNGV